MRVVGGRCKGLALVAPRGPDTRPTSDRLRETVFNVLVHRFDDPVSGARVLDLFAGTGAMGIEALSRGARSGLFVDVSTEARAAIRRNLEATGMMGAARISKRDAAHLGPAGAQGGFTLAFVDPPYGKGLARAALVSLEKGGWLAPGAIVVVEERRGVALEPPSGYDVADEREAGDSRVVFLVWKGA